MPRTALAIVDIASQGGIANVSFAAADFANGNMFDNDGNTILLAKNPTGGTITMTVRAVADEAGRTVDLALLIPLTSGQAIVGPLRGAWWNQRVTDAGKVYVDWSATGCTVAVLRQPPG
jgi:hypothetical protein